MKKTLILLGMMLLSPLTKAQLLLEALEAPDVISSKCLERVKDRNYGDGDHNFIYCAVQGPNGKKWLNLNLGAEYARESSEHFNPEAVPTGYNDWKAFGSLFQNLRRSDGHELVEYLHSSRGGSWGTTSPDDDYWYILTKGFLRESISYPTPHIPHPVYNIHLNEWSYDKLNINNWLEDSYLNPCPSGYRVMTSEDVLSFFQYPEKINIKGGSKWTASIVSNTDYPNLNILTPPIYGSSPNNNYSEILNDMIIESSALFSLENLNKSGTSTLWMIALPNSFEEFTYSDGNTVIKNGLVTEIRTTGFDRGVGEEGNAMADYGYNVHMHDHIMYRIGMGIRCVQSN